MHSNFSKQVALALGLLAAPTLSAAQDTEAGSQTNKSDSGDVVELETYTVEGQAEQDTTSQDVDALRRGSANATLGSYLDNMPNVDSASYGEAVGRPVVRGMSGYRVKILQNDHEVSDLSAMSQDHAVAVAPRTSERIELLKGPASLLYAAQSGGVVRISDAMDGLFDTPGLSGKLSNDLRAGQASMGTDGQVRYANDRWAAYASGLNHDADPYESGDGDVIADSDLSTQQGQLGLAWRPGSRSELQISGTMIDKDYGIPNSTPEITRINMERQEVTGSFRYYPAANWASELQVDAYASDYLHNETEAGRRDGLFGQERQSSAVSLEWLAGEWTGSTRLDVARGELQVCHEHDACERFTVAARSGGPVGESMIQQVETRGLPYSHGHPMPDTEDESFQLSTTLERPVFSAYSLSIGMHGQLRELTPDPSNIQQEWVRPAELDADHYRQQSDQTTSLSVGFAKPPSSDLMSWEASVSYLERFPSVDELYWNGFHHATDTYIFGNVDLDTERSINVDADMTLRHEAHRAQLSLFYYQFDGYIFQDQAFDANGVPLSDPFHLSEVWFTRQTDADFVGGSLRYEHGLAFHHDLPITLFGQTDVLSAQRANGQNLPRTAPANVTLGVVYDTSRWLASASAKRVFEANELAPNETPTDGYTWVSAYVQTTRKLGGQDLEFWLKGENLLNESAHNHLSVLKDTAPLPGRQLFAGISWRF